MVSLRRGAAPPQGPGRCPPASGCCDVRYTIRGAPSQRPRTGESSAATASHRAVGPRCPGCRRADRGRRRPTRIGRFPAAPAESPLPSPVADDAASHRRFRGRTARCGRVAPARLEFQLADLVEGALLRQVEGALVQVASGDFEEDEMHLLVLEDARLVAGPDARIPPGAVPLHLGPEPQAVDDGHPHLGAVTAVHAPVWKRDSGVARMLAHRTAPGRWRGPASGPVARRRHSVPGALFLDFSPRSG